MWEAPGKRISYDLGFFSNPLRAEDPGAYPNLAVGQEASNIVGRHGQRIVTIRPLKDGVIADFEVTSVMIKYFLAKVLKTRQLIRPRLVVAVPTGITSVEKRAVIEAAQQAGARQIHLVEEPMAAAIGAGLPVDQPFGNMIVDIGGGTTEVAVLSLGDIVYARSVCVGGDRMDAAIVNSPVSYKHLTMPPISSV